MSVEGKQTNTGGNSVASDILGRCNVLAAFTEEVGRVTRTFLSPPMRDVHEAVGGWMRQAGMSVRTDAVGNIIGRYAAAATTEPPPALLLGSHLDTVPNAGRYDGVLGVLLAIAAVQRLHETRRRLPFAIDVIGFSEEEGVRFGTSYLGSRAITGTFDPRLLKLQDRDGVSVAEAIRRFGADPGSIAAAAYDPRNVVGYAEVHIEQGPVLEAEGRSVGVVDAIAGQSRLQLQFAGKAGHAGTTPMPLRRDALAGAAEFVLAVEAHGRASPGLVATVGMLSPEPNASNVIAGAVHLSLDVRHRDDAVREQAVVDLLQDGERIACRRGMQFAVESADHCPAARMDARLCRLMGAAVLQTTGREPRVLSSGAGHDAAIMADVAPAAMLFVRSPGGLSHHPDEAVLAGDVEEALRVLETFILLLAEEPTCRDV